MLKNANNSSVFTRSRRRSTLAKADAATSALLISFAAAGLIACGGDGSGDSSSESKSSFSGTTSCTPRTYDQMSEYGYGCRESLPQPSPACTDCSGSEPTPTSRSANIAKYEEYEPNDTLENANAVAFPATSGDIVPGIEITGKVLEVSDESDYFILSPDRSGSYAIYLCADACVEQPTDSMVAIRVLDQSGELITGNPLFEESTKILTADLDAGIPYYVQIQGFDTDGLEYPYRLVIID